mmetsp:Transcript_82130/g.177372  ORF Transcript_82130/g.177372 Transcript_82130/m.177372 type:complete len:208 (+) Transcript_82130:991-1614(+)
MRAAARRAPAASSRASAEASLSSVARNSRVSPSAERASRGFIAAPSEMEFLAAAISCSASTHCSSRSAAAAPRREVAQRLKTLPRGATSAMRFAAPRTSRAAPRNLPCCTKSDENQGTTVSPQGMAKVPHDRRSAFSPLLVGRPGPPTAPDTKAGPGPIAHMAAHAATATAETARARRRLSPQPPLRRAPIAPRDMVASLLALPELH